MHCPYKDGRKRERGKEREKGRREGGREKIKSVT